MSGAAEVKVEEKRSADPLHDPTFALATRIGESACIGDRPPTIPDRALDGALAPQQPIDASAISALAEALQNVVGALKSEATARPHDLGEVSQPAIDTEKKAQELEPHVGSPRTHLPAFGAAIAYVFKFHDVKKSLPIAVALGLALLSAGPATILLSQSAGQHLSTKANLVESAPRVVSTAAPAAAPSSVAQIAFDGSRGLSGETNAFGDPVPASSGFMVRLQLSPPFDAIDSTLVDSRDTRIRLAQALPVGRSDVCSDDGGLRFACGLMGRAALQNFVHDRPIVCERLFFVPRARRAILDAQCWLDGEDLAEHQIRAGFAFPSELAGDRHRQAMEEAKSQRAGVWAGPYPIPKQDRSEEDARTVPFGSTRLTMPEPEAKPRTSARPDMVSGTSAPER